MFSIENAVGGYGKTTLLKYAMGLINRSDGVVSLDGQDLPAGTAKRVRAGLGYVPQGRFVFPRLTVAENIAAAAAANRRSRREVVEAALSEFPLLTPKANTLAGKLSGGQQQVLVIARALASNPRVLLLDEPTEGIQPSIVDEIAGIIQRMNRERRLSILVAEQDLEFCREIAERAYVMDRGTIVQQISIENLLGDQALVQRLLGV